MKVWGDANFLVRYLNIGNISKKRMIAFGTGLNNQDATISSLPYKNNFYDSLKITAFSL